MADRDCLIDYIGYLCYISYMDNALNGYAVWAHVLRDAGANVGLYYQAPLDARPVAVCVIKVFKNGKIRVRPTWQDGAAFTADAAHVDRFYRKA